MRELSELVETATSEIDAASDLAVLDAVRVSYLGKKGELTFRLKSLSELSAEERPAALAHLVKEIEEHGGGLTTGICVSGGRRSSGRLSSSPKLSR